ncbi:esterase/lipase family protein [Pseudonocardia saturnea]
MNRRGPSVGARTTAMVLSITAAAFALVGGGEAAAAPQDGSPAAWASTCSSDALGLDKVAIGLAPQLGTNPDRNPNGSPVAIRSDRRGKFVPVVMVHGWTSRDTHEDTRAGTFSHLIDLTANKFGSADTDRSLIGQLQRIQGAAVFTFDYRDYAARWVDDPHLGPGLGKVIDCLYRASGEEVIVVGHSMGGLIARYASAQPGANGPDRSSEISTVVTFGTPHTGSVAAMLAATILDPDDARRASILRLILSSCGQLSSREIRTGTLCDVLPPPVRTFASEAGVALRHGSQQLSALRPYPRSIDIDALAGSATFTAPMSWFNLPWGSTSVDVGDLIVTRESALHLADLSKQVKCSYQLNAVRAATDRIGLTFGLTSRADVADSPLGAMSGPCFHTQLMRSIELTNEATGAVNDDIESRRNGPAASLGPLVGDWGRHSTTLTIRADGSAETLERTYTPCGTSSDCTFTATMSVAAGPESSTTITYTAIAYLDADGNKMTLTAAEHADLDAYFPLQGEQVRAVVDDEGRLVLTPLGAFAQRAQRSDDGNTYCGQATRPGSEGPCGA